MPRPWRIRYAGAKYHVTTRGNARQAIFHADADRERFLKQLASALERDQVLLYAYALMPNHVHLLVETPWGNIDRFMQRLNTAYGMYRRYKHSRPGHCFQARYGAKLVAGDEYLLRVTRYIHLNPVKVVSMARATSTQRVAHLKRYPWSSYAGYVRQAATEEIIDYRWLGLMGRKTEAANRAAYRAYVESNVEGEDPVLQEVLLASRYAIGDDAFLAQVDGELQEVRKRKGLCGDIVWPVGREHGLEDVLKLVAGEFGVTPQSLREHGRRAGLAKQIAAELCVQFCGASQREVGRFLGYTGNGAVGKQRARLREILAAWPAEQMRVDDLRERLSRGEY